VLTTIVANCSETQRLRSTCSFCWTG